MDFQKVIYENVENFFFYFTTNIYIYGSQTFWSFMKFYFVYNVKVRFAFKKQPLCLDSSVYA